MLGEATSSLPVRLSVTGRTIGWGCGDQVVRNEAVAAHARGPADARVQGPGLPADLAAAGPASRSAPDARLPRRHRPGSQARWAQGPAVPGDRAGTRGGEPRPAALPGGSRAASAVEDAERWADEVLQ